MYISKGFVSINKHIVSSYSSKNIVMIGMEGQNKPKNVLCTVFLTLLFKNIFNFCFCRLNLGVALVLIVWFWVYWDCCFCPLLAETIGLWVQVLTAYWIFKTKCLLTPTLPQNSKCYLFLYLLLARLQDPMRRWSTWQPSWLCTIFYFMSITTV